MEHSDPSDIDELVNQALDLLEDAQNDGVKLTVEDACKGNRLLVDEVANRWKQLQRFNSVWGDGGENVLDETVPLDSESQKASSKENAPKDLQFSNSLKSLLYCDRGGLCEVYQADQPELKRSIAVKILRKDRLKPTYVSDFMREVEILGRMSHPGIVPVIGLGETDDGRPFYVMPFLGEGNLAILADRFHAHANRIRMAESRAFRELIQRIISASKTIAYAHNRGIVHRDLKPENIMLGRFGETIVIDWGCATRFSRDERFRQTGEESLPLTPELVSKASYGLTLRFASPEQLSGKDVGPESDIYSLGAILFKVLTGESPYQRLSDMQACKAVLSRTAVVPTSVTPQIPLALSAICQRAMAFDVDERYRTALEFASDLERFLADRPVSVYREPLLSRAIRIVERHRLAAGFAIATMFSIAIVTTILYAWQRVASHRAEKSALESLSLAATLAARSGEQEIDQRWRALEKISEQPSFVAEVMNCRTNDKQQLEALQSRLEEFADAMVEDGQFSFESLFVLDEDGDQLARFPYSDTISRNFAYRDYFHGLGNDLKVGVPSSIATKPVLSCAYISVNDNRVKVAFSVPIVDAQSAEKKVIGRICLSSPVNELDMFQGMAALNIRTMLVDLRDYLPGLVVHSPQAGVTAQQSTRLTDLPRLEGDTLRRIKDGIKAADVSRAVPQLVTQLNLAGKEERSQEALVSPISIEHRKQRYDTGWCIVVFRNPIDN